jgi:hypothetical protein
MTPKQKALELVGKMQCNFTPLSIVNAKQCALIAVDEILNSVPSRRYWDTYDDETPSAIIYWQEVKQEIEKL